jgi:hypothetical protein
MGCGLNVAIATCAALPGGYDEDQPLAAALRSRGAGAAFEVWDDPTVDWGRFDRVVVRSTWDYTFKRDEFIAWAESLEGRVQNAPQLMRWNSDKRYLAALADAGLPVVETRFAAPSEPLPDLDGEVVVKPAISAGARDTGRFSASAHPQALALIERIRGEGRTAMVQPYLSAVDDRGETAIVFTAGRISHVLRKRALLRPDEEAPIHGDELGTAAAMWDPDLVLPGEATAAEHQLGDRVMAEVTRRFGDPPLYARVDMLDDGEGSPLVLELEAVEPCLYLRMAPSAAGDLATAVLA